jgi:hypothetical protein
MRPTGAIEERTRPYQSGEAESEERRRKFRVLPNGSALSCRPVNVPRPIGRPPVSRPGSPIPPWPAAGSW